MLADIDGGTAALVSSEALSELHPTPIKAIRQTAEAREANFLMTIVVSLC
jgi:hypothetical protein